MDIINNCRQYFDVKLLVLSGLIVSEGLRKSSLNVTVFFSKFQSQFDSLYFSLVKFLFCLFFCFFSWLFATSHGE